MAAGGSQAVQAVRSVLSGAWASKQTDREARKAGRHAAGCRGERAVCSELSTLAVHAVHHFDDLRVRAAKDRRANIDHLVIGPAGVFVIDAKNWAGRVTVRGGLLLQDGVPRDERLIALRWLRQRVADVLAAAGYGLRPQAIVVFATPHASAPSAVGDVLLTDVSRVAGFLASRPAVLSAQQVSGLVEVLTYAFPPYDVDARDVAEAEGLLFADDQTRHAGLATALSQPVEEWMVWLHPEQATCARRSFAGPARIRGAAGTGKTSVALHRVEWLASTRPGRFLVTSFVNTLPQALQPAYANLSPSTARRVDFRHVHGVALDVLRERGTNVSMDSRGAAFAAAWQRHREAFRNSGLSKSYFQEEVASVLKGRGVPDLDSYLALDRIGRRTPLRAEMRQQVWALKESYDAELARQGKHDFIDVLRLARDEVRREPYRKWTGVAVDEVQDLPMAGLQLLHELAGRDRPDGLLLIGDGQQAIYPGGFRLVEAGISVAGRAVVLRTNYRNTVEILATARSIVLEDPYDDGDLVAEPGERDVEVIRHGELPWTGQYRSEGEHDQALLWDLRVVADRGAPWSDLAVLCQTNALAERYAALLTREGVPCALFKSTSAVGADAVKVGTWARSKGMEFPHVFLPLVNRGSMLLTGSGKLAEEEKAELHRRTLFVAMTRARNTLWVGRV